MYVKRRSRSGDVVVGSVVVVVVFVAVGRRMGFVGIGSRSRRKGFEGGVVDVGGGGRRKRRWGSLVAWKPYLLSLDRILDDVKMEVVFYVVVSCRVVSCGGGLCRCCKN